MKCCKFLHFFESENVHFSYFKIKTISVESGMPFMLFKPQRDFRKISHLCDLVNSVNFEIDDTKVEVRFLSKENECEFLLNKLMKKFNLCGKTIRRYC
jgi:hypothetical protein